MKYSKILGIDLGTTNTCMSILKSGIPTIIKNKLQNTTTPSYVNYAKNVVEVGEYAKLNQAKNVGTTVYASKRLIGRKMSDLSTQDYLKKLPYKTFSHKNGDTWIKIGDKILSPVKVAADILKYMKDCASDFLKPNIVKDAIITVPAYFNDVQRKATKDAGRIAGLNVVRVINEPTAAALAYGLDRKGDGTIVVYDLGGGTFDVSILNVKDGVFEVKSVNGNSELGGEDVDMEIMANVINRFYNEKRIRNDDIANLTSEVIKENLEKEMCSKNFLKKDSLQRIKSEVEKMKIELSSKDSYRIFLKDIFIDKKSNKTYDLDLLYKRDDIEKIAKPIIMKTVEPCKKAMRDARLKNEDIDEVILVGGATRMPLVRKIVESVFNKIPNTTVDPDEAVAKGAAIQGGIIEGRLKDLVLLDVNGLSLGIETVGNLFSKIIKRNSTIPCKETSTFTTSEDNQEVVEIRIFQGERPIVHHNKFLGEIKLKDLPKMKKGVPRIEVTFECDRNGILKVTAKDAVTKKEQSMEVVPASGLTEKEIKKIIDEADQKKKDDELELKCIQIKIDINKILIDENKFRNKDKLDKLKSFLYLDRFDPEEAQKIINELLSV